MRITIDLSDNFILSIRPAAFRNLNSLSIDLSKNQLDEFNSNIFDNVWVVFLKLDHNNLRRMDKGSLSSLVDTIEINLGFNRLEFISESLYENASSLQTLYLNNNLLTNINFLNPAQFSNLRELDASFNSIEFVMAFDFNDLTSLNKLNIGNNPVKLIDTNVLNLDFLVSINLTNVSCSISNNFSSNFQVIDLSSNLVSNFSFQEEFYENLTELYLRNTNLLFEKFNSSLFPSIVRLDLSENRDDGEFIIGTSSSLKWLCLSQMQIDSLDRFDFSMLFELETLNLSVNNIKIIKEAYFSLSNNLVEIDLSSNQIETIEFGSFQFMQSLSVLNLENNNLQKFEFSHFDQLSVLNIKNNLVLKSLEINGLPSKLSFILIKKVDFSGNSLESIRLGPLINEKNSLTFLLLSNNLIEEISEDFFLNMLILNTIELDSNKISSVHASAFSDLNQLENLNLANNLIETLDDRIFSNQLQLKKLNLASNRLKYINVSLFSQLYNLNSLDLSFNRLKLIEDNSFVGLSYLQTICINENSNDLELTSQALDGLSSIVDVFVSFKTLIRESNQKSIKRSLHVQLDKPVGDVNYFKSINVICNITMLDVKEREKYCLLVLDFLTMNIQVNLKTDSDFVLFLNYCQKLQLI